MQPSDHIRAQLASFSHVLAPAASPTHPISSWRYATETWSSGAVILGIIILLLAVIALAAVLGKATSR